MRERRSISGVAARFVLPILLLPVSAGCGGTAAPPTVDADVAKVTLDRTLGSWQKGETIDTMKNASPPVVVSDKSWGRGEKLTKYELDGPSKSAGADRKFQVNLWLTDDKGKIRREVVEYMVGVDPVHTVIRAVVH
jgi:hypothetical protein